MARVPAEQDGAPGSGQSAVVSRLQADTPLTRIVDHDAAYWTCVSSVEYREGWKLYHNVDLLGRLYPNHAGDFRAREGAGAAIAQEIIHFYRSFGATPAAFVDGLSTPGDLVPKLLEAGFDEWSGALGDLMLYVGPDGARPSDLPVTRVRTAADKADWISLIEDGAGAWQRSVLQRLYRREIEDPRVTSYLVRLRGRPAARCELFVHDQIGRVEALLTLSGYRRRGLAAALVRCAVADSFARGSHLTYVLAEPAGQAQRLYERLGFRTVAPNLVRSFVWLH